MAKPKKQAHKQKNKKQQVKVVKKIAKQNVKQKKRQNYKKGKKQIKYTYSSDSEKFSSDDVSTPYDEETSNPISERDSEKSWKDENKKNKNKKKNYQFPIKKFKVAPLSPEPQQDKPITLKEKAEMRWDSSIKKWLEMEPEDAVKEAQELNLVLDSKLELGNELTAYVKKLQKIGEQKMTYIYCPSDLKQFNTIKEQLLTKTVKELQEELVKNSQPKTDTKAAVLERVVDGRVLGKIPKCPNCFGGRLRFNNEDGTYICPGYVDGGDNCVKGDDYIFCFRKYLLGQIQRESWEI